MQSFLAKHEDYEEQVISDGNFFIIIKKLPYPAKANIEYKLAKSKARNKGAKVTTLGEKKIILKQIRHRPLKEIIRKRKVMGLPVRLDEEET
jgi:hypothetical protein